MENLRNKKVVYSTVQECATSTKTTNSPDPIVVCSSDQLNELDQLVSDRYIGKLCVLNNGRNMTFPVNISRNKITYVNDQDELMTHVASTSMLSFIAEARKHEKHGDISLANSRLDDALHSLDCLASYIPTSQ
jgi:hypothetical protein